MPQFGSTIKRVQDGVKGFTISLAVTNIEGWEATLSKMETPGAKGLVRDLERLKKLIQADPINGDKVKELVAKLGKATVTFAGKAKSKNAEKAKQLGEALAKAAE
ncbi:MAG: hypothetical protein JWO26_838 [Rhodospirillales bacterium]|jgi:hypothetical protein|nr:hypothetical protein [Rhodospirillales bacterium]MDB5381206.1 hypothetical protein [Rhodospirillales bacterium]